MTYKRLIKQAKKVRKQLAKFDAMAQKMGYKSAELALKHKELCIYVRDAQEFKDISKDRLVQIRHISDDLDVGGCWEEVTIEDTVFRHYRRY